MISIGGKTIIVIQGRDPLTGRVVYEIQYDYTGSNAARIGASPSEKVNSMKRKRPELTWDYIVK